MDPYQLLGLPRSASLDEAEDAYRRLLRVHHPDLHQNDGPHALAAAEHRTRALNAAIRQLRVIIPQGARTGASTPAGAAAPAGAERRMGHAERADRPMVACPLCGEWFSTAPSLKAHVAGHHDLRLDPRRRARWHRRAPLPLSLLLPMNTLVALVTATVTESVAGETGLAVWVFVLTMAPSIIRLFNPDEPG